MDVTTTITIERGEDEFEVEIRATVNGRYVPASWTSPAEGGEVESIAAFVDGQTFELSDVELEKAEEAVHEASDEMRRGYHGPEREDY